MADIDGKLESQPVQQIPPLSDWSPLTIYFKVKESSTAGIRFYIPKAVNAGTEIIIKNIRVEKMGNLVELHLNNQVNLRVLTSLP